MSRAVAKIIHRWAQQCFGARHVSDLPTRSIRLAEEAIEFAQSLQVSRELMHRLVDMVYDKPRDHHWLGELGDVLVCAMSIAEQQGLDIEDIVVNRLTENMSKRTPEEFHERNNAKSLAGFDIRAEGARAPA